MTSNFTPTIDLQIGRLAMVGRVRPSLATNDAPNCASKAEAPLFQTSLFQTLFVSLMDLGLLPLRGK